MSNLKTLRLTKTLDNYLPPAKMVDSEEAELIIVGGQQFRLSDYPGLRGVFKVGVGTENIDFDGLEASRIRFRGPSAETSALIYDETAAFACHLIMTALYRATGDFDSWTKFDRSFIKDRNVLLLGRGNIGSRVERLLSPMLNVKIFDLAESPLAELPSLIEQADVVSLHIPGGAENGAFVNAEFLKKLADGATLVNTSRGSLIDEDALLDELMKGRLYAYLDVFSSEPYRGPLRSAIGKHLFVTPHVASTSRAFHDGLVADLEKFSIELSTS